MTVTVLLINVWFYLRLDTSLWHNNWT